MEKPEAQGGTVGALGKNPGSMAPRSLLSTSLLGHVGFKGRKSNTQKKTCYLRSPRSLRFRGRRSSYLALWTKHGSRLQRDQASAVPTGSRGRVRNRDRDNAIQDLGVERLFSPTPTSLREQQRGRLHVPHPACLGQEQ